MEEMDMEKMYFCNQEEDVEGEDYEFEDASFCEKDDD
jgi:hypothetical protein